MGDMIMIFVIVFLAFLVVCVHSEKESYKYEDYVDLLERDIQELNEQRCFNLGYKKGYEDGKNERGDTDVD